ncbi:MULTISPECIES: hypothetical protein [Pseudomonas]|uniref:hypothetical protein n=1 Tax=Pseudomonas TaxID=286 RepID=UPI0023DC8CC8|nr:MULTISPECIES: hypothetical protein [Pseudomonas]WEJ22372.1 hypothetical protein N0B28_03535 [Pseudomonas sp. SD17-1]
MEKTVFMDFQEYIGVVNELRDETGFGVYISYRMNEPFLLVKDRGFVRLDSFEIFPQMKIIMGSDRDFSFKGKAQIEVDRKDKVGFVRACYGGEDEYAIGATIFSGDKSESEKVIDRVLTRILKKIARKGVKDSGGNVSYVTDRYYWTEGAFVSGKNWHLFLGRGVDRPKNSCPGYFPK